MGLIEILVLLYLIVGLVTAAFIMGMVWRRTSLGGQRGRLLIAGGVLVVAWLAVGLLALADRNLTLRDYIDAWLFPSVSSLD